MSGDQVGALTLATYEALANAAIHAYLDDTGTFDLLARYLPDRDRVEVTVTDYGRWRPPPDDPGPFSGRGIPLIQALAEHVDITRSTQGTTVRMHWNLGLQTGTAKNSVDGEEDPAIDRRGLSRAAAFSSY